MNTSTYAGMSADEYNEHLSNFLLNSWSFSKVSSFARNEKAFEMQYIYGEYGKRSATTIAGEAYHHALELFFTALKQGTTLGIEQLEQSAFDYISDVKGKTWKLQKTTPTVEECISKASETVTKLLRNFLAELSVYTDDIEEIISVELSLSEFVTVNGVDIPLPCNAKIDLIIKTKDGKTVSVDHKSKNTFTDEEELKMAIGRQAITYAIVYEASTGNKIDEVWFVENKYSKNKSGEPQLSNFKVVLSEDTRKLYEALLYEPLRRMIQAVSDPDYVYLINDSDSFTDKAELYDFWCKTMISEVDDFNVEDSKKEMITKRLRKIRDTSMASISPSVIKNFQQNAKSFIKYDLSTTNMTTEQKIEHVLRTFGIQSVVAHKFEGYSSNTFLLEVSAGVKIASVHKYRLDIANGLNVSDVRIGQSLYVYEGKSYISIEFAKKRTENLYFNPSELVGYRIPLGKDNFNQTIVWDLENNSTPHMLLCGATGSGKSVQIITIIEYAILAGIEVVIFDPKNEFRKYSTKRGVTVFQEIEDIEAEMSLLVIEMNERVANETSKLKLVVFDEFADAVAQSRTGNQLKVYENVCVGLSAKGIPKMKRECTGELKSLEENLKILLQKGRSSGYRVIAATQRASVKVITGDAKVNFPVQVCLRVPKETDSRVVIDESGAETLQGNGDALIKSPEYLNVVRYQGFYYDPKQPITIHDAGVTVHDQI